MTRGPIVETPAGPGADRADGGMTSPLGERIERRVPRLALSPDEAAASLGISRDHLDKHIAHELRWVRRGRRKFVALDELQRWLQAAAALTVDVR